MHPDPRGSVRVSRPRSSANFKSTVTTLVFFLICIFVFVLYHLTLSVNF